MTISPGVYRIKNAKTNTIFDQARSSTKIHGWARHDGANQRWFVIPSGDGVVLKNVESGQYAYTTSIQNGGKVFPSNNPTIWKLSRDENEWAISLPGTNYIIEIGGANVANGGGINLWENVAYKHQRWLFEKISDGQPQELQQPNQIVELPEEYWLRQEHQPVRQNLQQIYQPPASSPVLPGTYFLRNAMSGTLVSLYGGSTDEGAEISGYAYNGGGYQKWELQPTGHGQNMTLRNVQTNTYLWFQGRSFVPSFVVKSSYRPQEYVISIANRGFYISPAQQPGHALSLLYGSGENRAEIGVWHNEQQDNQKWYFDHT